MSESTHYTPRDTCIFERRNYQIKLRINPKLVEVRRFKPRTQNPYHVSRNNHGLNITKLFVRAKNKTARAILIACNPYEVRWH
jgi:hypothetical protein